MTQITWCRRRMSKPADSDGAKGSSSGGKRMMDRNQHRRLSSNLLLLRRSVARPPGAHAAWPHTHVGKICTPAFVVCNEVPFCMYFLKFNEKKAAQILSTRLVEFSFGILQMLAVFQSEHMATYGNVVSMSTTAKSMYQLYMLHRDLSIRATWSEGTRGWPHPNPNRVPKIWAFSPSAVWARGVLPCPACRQLCQAKVSEQPQRQIHKRRA